MGRTGRAGAARDGRYRRGRQAARAAHDAGVRDLGEAGRAGGRGGAPVRAAARPRRGDVAATLRLYRRGRLGRLAVGSPIRRGDDALSRRIVGYERGVVRSDERRVGKEGSITLRSRWWTYK